MPRSVQIASIFLGILVCQQKRTKDFVAMAGADKNWYPTENALNLRLQIE